MLSRAADDDDAPRRERFCSATAARARTRRARRASPHAREDCSRARRTRGTECDGRRRSASRDPRRRPNVLEGPNASVNASLDIALLASRTLRARRRRRATSVFARCRPHTLRVSLAPRRSRSSRSSPRARCPRPRSPTRRRVQGCVFPRVRFVFPRRALPESADARGASRRVGAAVSYRVATVSIASLFLPAVARRVASSRVARRASPRPPPVGFVVVVFGFFSRDLRYRSRVAPSPSPIDRDAPLHPHRLHDAGRIPPHRRASRHRPRRSRRLFLRLRARRQHRDDRGDRNGQSGLSPLFRRRRRRSRRAGRRRPRRRRRRRHRREADEADDDGRAADRGRRPRRSRRRRVTDRVRRPDHGLGRERRRGDGRAGSSLVQPRGSVDPSRVLFRRHRSCRRRRRRLRRGVVR